ncbi:carboxypeptidase inhibitor SmCI-like isoform X3 [Paramormyrops kingsleyae]|uniref:carboxypeptidase inhibitor SmCI-like isoform X3 n=1 Tax=Paramormyrops kingsleyae TaxID=1676925 RepID=UPI000CD639ED|nr:tissue factor pathway inhibitor-like isoform X3 [Paramormyrops kingsleyae]
MARLSPASFILLLCASHFSSSNTDIYGAEREQPELKLFHHSCALKKDEGLCKALLDRFYFDVETKQCESFGYGGCGGNANNFETVEECEETCVVKPDKSPCDLPEEVGPCRGIIIRYFFNGESQRCESFFYGGCLGNANNFRSKAECNAKCLKQGPERREMAGDTNPESRSGSPPDHCFSPVEKGTCRESIKRYAYSPTSKRCHSFRYGGCSGNGNNFASRRECMKTCVRGMYNHNQRATR